jgi:hypothetical protein
MNIHTLPLDTGSTLSVRDSITPDGHRWAMAYGMRHELSHGTERVVTLSIRSGSLGIDCDYTVYRYGSLTISPDEARALAARLLDAADDADERSDEDLPVKYDLTPAGREVLV